MLSTHLAALYNVEPRALVQAVKRNRERFPGDFMFQLTAAEWENLKSQIVISSWGGSRRAAPYAFTEHGIAMLSSVLKSRRAIQVNIEIMRAFVRLFLNPVNDLNGAKRLNDWNDWNGPIPVMNRAKRWNVWNGPHELVSEALELLERLEQLKPNQIR
jgi:hypothetical protein